MGGYDIFMIIVLVAATGFGAYKGLAWQIASMASIFASYVVALNLREPLAQVIQATPPWNIFLSMLILYILTSLVIWIGFRIVAKSIDRLKLKDFDRQFGALLGLAKGVVLCVIITLFAVTLMDTQRQTIIDSYSGYYIAVLLNESHGVMPDEVHQVLEPYVHPFDERLEDRYGRSYDTQVDPQVASEPVYDPQAAPPYDRWDQGAPSYEDPRRHAYGDSYPYDERSPYVR